MKLHHIGFVVKDLSSTLNTFESVLGLKPASKPFLDKIQQVNEIFLKIEPTLIQLFEPMSKDSPVGNFLRKHGEKLHHLCFEVDDLNRTLKDLKAKGIKIIWKPFKGFDKRRVAFVDPQQLRGLLVELVENVKERKRP